jgi:hypothetical protein
LAPLPHPVKTALSLYGEDVFNEFVACHCKTYDGPPLKITDKGARKNIPYIVTFVQAKFISWSNTSVFHKSLWIDTKYQNTYTDFSRLLFYGSIVIFINQVDRRISTCTQWVHIDSEVSFISYRRNMHSYENTRKTWNTDFIIVCQNLIGLCKWI